THDAAEARAYDADPLIARTIAVNVLLDLHDTATRLIDDAAAIRTPTLILSAGSDWVVTVAAQARFFERLGASDKRMRVFPGMYHDVLHEADRHLAIDEIRGCTRGAGSRAAGPAPLLDAAQHGYTRDEYHRLAGPPARLAARTVGFALLKSAMRSLGRLSAGIRLGWRTGF